MPTTSPSPIDRKLYGHMADDVVLLRSTGKEVSRFKGDYRVGKEVVTAAQLQGMAIALRERQKALVATRKPDSPRRPMARHEIERPKTADGNLPGEGERTAVNSGHGTSGALADPSNAAPEGRVDVGLTSDVPPGHTPQADGAGNASVTPVPDEGVGAGPIPADDTVCGCGKPATHFGRCWFRRGMAAPVTPLAKGKRSKGTCQTCGGQLSYWARGLSCRHCYLESVKKRTEAERIGELERQVARLTERLDQITGEGR